MTTAQEFVNALKSKGAKNISKTTSRLLYVKGPDEVPVYKVELLAGTLLIYDGVYTPNENDEKLDANSTYFIVTMFPIGDGDIVAEDLFDEVGLGSNKTSLQKPNVTDPQSLRFFGLIPTDEGDVAVETIATYAKSWVNWVGEAKKLKDFTASLAKTKSTLAKSEQVIFFKNACQEEGLDASAMAGWWEDIFTGKDGTPDFEELEDMIETHSFPCGPFTLDPDTINASLQLKASKEGLTLEMGIIGPPIFFGSTDIKVRSDLPAGSDVAVYGESARKWLCYGVAAIDSMPDTMDSGSLPLMKISLASEEDAAKLVNMWVEFNRSQQLVFESSAGDMIELFKATPIDFTPDDADSTMPGDVSDEQEKELNRAVWFTDSAASR